MFFIRNFQYDFLCDIFNRIFLIKKYTLDISIILFSIKQCNSIPYDIFDIKYKIDNKIDEKFRF